MFIFEFMAGAGVIAGVDMIWFYTIFQCIKDRPFRPYPSLDSPLKGSLLVRYPDGGKWAILAHALVASFALAFLGQTENYGQTRVVSGAVLGFYAYFTFNLTHATISQWTLADAVPDVLYGSAVLALAGFVQETVV